MALALRHGLSFCVTSGQPVFLDLPADRYFSLAPDKGTAFLELLADPADPAPRTALDELNLLAADEGAPLTPAAAAPVARSLLDDLSTRVRAGAFAQAAVRSAQAVGELRWRGLATAIERFRRRKARMAADREDLSTAIGIARAHEELALLTASLDKCLWRSLAVAHHLLDRGQRPDLVLSVHLRPFKAHCWVQLGDAVANDRVETVRTFTPILVV